MENSDSLKKSAIIVAGGKYANIACAFIANIILSRLLTPEDFGIIAVVTVFSTFFSLFSDMGFGAGVIQNKNLNRDDENNIFSITIYISLVLCAIFFFLSYGIAAWYADDVYILVGKLLSLSLMFSTANMIPSALMMKEKRFVEVGIRSIVIAVITYSVTILLAVCGLKYYALVAQSIISNGVLFLWNWKSSKLRFVFRPKMSSLRKILSFSTYNFLYDLINYFSRNLDNVLTGKTMGSIALGFYNKAYTLMLYPTNYLTNVITPILHPVLSEYQDDKNYIYKQYIKIFKLLLCLGMFFTIGCFSASNEIVRILYGPQWNEAAKCVHILSWTISVQMVCASCTSIFRSLGRTDLRMKSSLIYVPVQIVFIVIGAYSRDIKILSYWVAVSYLIRFVIEYYYLIVRAFQYSLMIFIKDIGILLIDYVVLLAFSGILYQKIQIENYMISFAVKDLMCTVVYFAVIFISKQQNTLLIILPKKVRDRLCK